VVSFSGDIIPVNEALGTLNISAGTAGQLFRARDGSEVNISGGTFGNRFQAETGSVVNISGGTFEGFLISALQARSGSVVNISGGDFGDFFDALDGSEVNISGGNFGRIFRANDGSVVNISGGSFLDFFNANSGSEVNVSGGSLGISIRFRVGSTVNLIGSDFVLDGQPLDGDLTIDNAFTITDRDVTLSGRFADGSAFSYDLNTTVDDDDLGADFVNADSTLTVTLVSAVTDFILGDCNQNGVVEFADIPSFIAVLQAGGFLEEADCNVDGVVDFADIPAFIAILQAS